MCAIIMPIPFLFFGVFYVLTRSNYSLRVLWMLDLVVCTICHGTIYRTISSWSWEHRGKKRYALQVVIIDFLSRVFGDEPDHCKRAYQWELENNLTFKEGV